MVVLPPGLLVKVQFPDAGKPFKTTLPVATSQVGCVIVPIVGASGVVGCVLITILADEIEVQPIELLTVYVYVPAASPIIVLLVPVPVVIIPPGLLVNVQFPDEGKPFKTTLPVATSHVGCVIVPIVGAPCGSGCISVSRFADEADAHPAEFFTLKVNIENALSPVTVQLVPVPNTGVLSSDLVNNHEPDEGKPFKTTLAVAKLQVGSVIVPISGAFGIMGGALITTLFDGSETFPTPSLKLNEYVPGASPDMVALVPYPTVVVSSGWRINIQFPDDGNPVNETLPVEL